MGLARDGIGNYSCVPGAHRFNTFAFNLLEGWLYNARVHRILAGRLGKIL